ncbi:uncharacterized protein LOC126470912 [Schistocerca serialis cubense]|uniref:uncharacterized protein LOC126470912 n=1 Tax=Schistocerca serialis cubense TaxID=2023355 RepID=UPI00214F162D|nr:uncharacterized protein LOC126470912 [Schistocerca serialis cubense]
MSRYSSKEQCPFYTEIIALVSDGKRKCGFLDLKCLQKHREELEAEQGESCSCAPECSSVEYLAEASTGILGAARYPASDHLMDGVNDSSISEVMLIHVFFVDLVGTRYRRDVYSTWRGLLVGV